MTVSPGGGPATGAALGIGLWLSALNVRYRDVRYSIPFLIQLWFLSTPVMYPSGLLPSRWRVFPAARSWCSPFTCAA